MAEGNIPKPINLLVCQHQFTIPDVEVASGSVVTILNNVDLSTLTYAALDTVPTGRTLIGASLLWATNSSFVATDTLTADGKLTMKIMNFSSSSVTVKLLRILAFYT